MSPFLILVIPLALTMIGIMLIGFDIVHDQRGESFQPTQSSGWIPRSVLQREPSNADADPSPSGHDRLDRAFGSEIEAGDFSVQDAKSWIDHS